MRSETSAQRVKKYLLLLIGFLFIFPVFAQAEERGIIVSPRIIDEKVKAGDLLKYEVLIKNNLERKVNIYAVLNDISSTEGEIQFMDPSELDKDTSLVRWIKFKRGSIELMPGDEVKVPLEINISGTATVGKRFARIAFPYGSNRAQAGGASSRSQLLINVEIMDNVVEKAQIQDFSSVSNVFLSAPGNFILKINNFGNQTITPRGSIYIYNRRGEQVFDIDANSGGESIVAGELWEKNIKWDELKGFGKFKARLEMEYGAKDKRDLQDTVFFWIFPWKLLLAAFGGTFVFLVLMVTWIFKRTYKHQHRHHDASEQEDQVEEEEEEGVINLKQS